MNDMNVSAIAAPNYTAIKQKQQATWASGDFAVVGTTLQIVGESLAEAADIRADERVLDVAAGNGNATLAAARRFARVTSTDYVPALLDRGRERARAEGLAVRFQEADVEELPFPGRQLRRGAVHLRRDVCARPGPHRARNDARAAPGRPPRHGELDAGRFHRAAVQGDRRARAAAGRPEVARPCGAARRTSPSSSVHPPRRSAASDGSSIFATARPRTGCRSFATTTAPRTRLSRPSTRRASRRWSATCKRCSHELNVAGDASLVVPAEYLEIVITKALRKPR